MLIKQNSCETNTHEYWMKIAIKLAVLAMQNGDAPVGAVIVKNNEIIGQGQSNAIVTKKPFGHAEMIAIEMATKNIRKRTLHGASI